MKAKKPRKPVDSTMRNVRAANKRIKALEDRVAELWRWAESTSDLLQQTWRPDEQPKRG